MLEIIFAFILGACVMAMGCFAVMGQDDGIQSAGIIAIGLCVALATVLGFQDGGFTNPRDVLIHLLGEAGTTHMAFTGLGAAAGTGFVLYVEGTVDWVWRRLFPKSAPTEFIGAGKRGQGQMPKPPKMSAALMGTSTAGFAVQGLDVKTTALIKLSLFAFKNNRTTLIGVENSLKLGDGRRYHAFQKLVAEAGYNKSLKDIIHPYYRAINGNQSAARLMFGNLCQLAHDTKNTNKATINRLVQIGQSLGLSAADMGQAIGNGR